MTNSDTRTNSDGTSRWATLAAGSYVGGEFLRLRQRVAAIAPNARSVQGLNQLRQWLQETEFASSSFTVASGQRVTATLERWVTNSWGYQWLTAEPDPEVIVIDLRDSVVVGPIIQLLDWLTPCGIHALRESVSYKQISEVGATVRDAPIRMIGAVILAIALLQLFVASITGSLGAGDRVVLLTVATVGLYGLRETRPWGELRETRVVRTIRPLLEPPTPPENELQSKETTRYAAEKDPDSKTEEK